MENIKTTNNKEWVSVDVNKDPKSTEKGPRKALSPIEIKEVYSILYISPEELQELTNKGMIFLKGTISNGCGSCDCQNKDNIKIQLIIGE